jgi:hypothetical protein
MAKIGWKRRWWSMTAGMICYTSLFVSFLVSAYTYIFLQHSPRGMLHIYRYVLVSAYGTYTHLRTSFCNDSPSAMTNLL